jgi:hypothetical protein
MMEMTGDENVRFRYWLATHDLSGPPFLCFAGGMAGASTELVTVRQSQVHA